MIYSLSFLPLLPYYKLLCNNRQRIQPRQCPCATQQHPAIIISSLLQYVKTSNQFSVEPFYGTLTFWRWNYFFLILAHTVYKM